MRWGFPHEYSYPSLERTLIPLLVTFSYSLSVDLEGVEPSSEQLILRHAKILFVNVLMISQNTRFKAILSHSDAFSTLLWVAGPLKHIERLETTFYFAL